MTISQVVNVAASQTTSGPGVYYVTVPGVTVTLETWTHWSDISRSVTIKDMTGSQTPNITVAAPPVIGGAVDGLAFLIMPNPLEAITFRPYQGGVTWSATG